ncbi:MAG: MATE family efflux transporter [Muribaculaceae bacterium]|nr:MATE family efflux transporter [Muribaculaceae bacterium]
MKRDSIDLGSDRIPHLFRRYLVPTLLGMLAICAVTATDGIFVGRGIGDDALAAVNICIAPTMVMMGIFLMLGVGSSVVASIHLASGNVKAARLNITQAIICATSVTSVFLLLTLSSIDRTGHLLGSSDALLPLVREYMPWVFVCCLFQGWSGIGLFIVRLDGSPKYAMWCNVIPGLMNIILDYIFIFPLDMGLRGAAVATCISCAAGGFMALYYLGFLAGSLRFIRIKLSRKSMLLSLRNLGYQCKIGVSALLGEATMGVLMLTGNLVFMHYLGEEGVGAFSIACYYCPFAFMVGNAIAQSAQPIISFNYGKENFKRVGSTEKLAIYSALICGAFVTTLFILFPDELVSLFLDPHLHTAQIAIAGFPKFSVAFIFFIFNLTAIGYFQSVEKVIPSVVFALCRGLLFLVPAFVVLPMIWSDDGIWLALGVSELLTSLFIAIYYVYGKSRKECAACHEQSKDE